MLLQDIYIFKIKALLIKSSLPADGILFPQLTFQFPIYSNITPYRADANQKDILLKMRNSEVENPF